MQVVGGDLLFSVGAIPIKNTMLSVLLVDVLLLLIGLMVYFRSGVVPSAIQAVFEMLLEFIESVMSIIPDKIRGKLIPVFFLWFIFILTANWIGLIPGMETILLKTSTGVISLLKGPTSDLNLTLSMSIISFVLVEGIVLAVIGIKGWFKHFFHGGGVLLPVFLGVGLLEVLLEPIKFLTLAIRLFGNILAGETLILTLSHIPLVAVPFLLLEILVGVLQALVFVTLTIAFLGLMLQDSSNLNNKKLKPI